MPRMRHTYRAATSTKRFSGRKLEAQRTEGWLVFATRVLKFASYEGLAAELNVVSFERFGRATVYELS